MNRYSGVATGGGGLNTYAAGNKQYGSGRPNPTMGPVDPMGYRERDLQTRSRRNAMLKQIQAMMVSNYYSSANLGGPLGQG